MYRYPRAFNRLKAELEKLPGIGTRTATRLSFHLLERQQEDLDELAQAITSIKRDIQFCQECHNLTSEELCSICQQEDRNTDIICIVESPGDVIAMEKTGEFRGIYHVLHGLISPLDNIGPEELSLDNLEERIKKFNIKEIIIATDPSAEGDATALYLQKKLADLDVKLSRLGQGLPAGGDLEYADEVTLSRSLAGRQEIQ